MTNQLATIGNGATAPDRLTFTDERLQQIRNQICKGGTDAEMEMFCTIAQRREREVLTLK